MSVVKEKIFLTEKMSPFACRWSPFIRGKAVATASANFGLVGGGNLYALPEQVMESSSNGFPRALPVSRGSVISDLSWSECRPDQLIAAAGNGSLLLITLFNDEIVNIESWKCHKRETSSVHWNPIDKNGWILSSSWDGSIVASDPNTRSPVLCFSNNDAIDATANCSIHRSKWSPHDKGIFAASSADGFLSIWDSRQNPNSNPGDGSGGATFSSSSSSSSSSCIFRFQAHSHEALAMDWLKYDQKRIVTGGADGKIQIWDLRFMGSKATPINPAISLIGHPYAVKSIACSPHFRHCLVSTSYDMTWRLWDLSNGTGIVMEQLTEFVVDVDFDLFTPNLLSLCCWDESIRIFSISPQPPLSPM